MRFAAALAALLIGACGATAPTARAPAPQLDGPVPARSTLDDGSRATPPLAASGHAVALPPILTHAMKNGIRVLYLERHETPLLTVAVVSDRGADQAEGGIAEFWERVALRASEKYPWWDVSEAWNDLGVDYDATAIHDASVVSIQVMSKIAEPAVTLLGDLIAHPVFPERSRELAAQRMRAALQLLYAKPAGQLELAVRRHFYPALHPYQDPYWPAANIAKVTDQILHAYHENAFTPAHLTVIGAGDLSAQAFFALCETAFAGIKGPAVGAQPPPKPPADAALDPRFTVVDRSGATQAQIAFTWMGPTRFVEDHTALTLAANDFEDSLHARVRTEKGLTYGVHSTYAAGRGRLPHEVRTAVEAANVGEVVRDAFALLGERATTKLTDAELGQVRGSMGTPAIAFDANNTTVSAMALLAVYGLPLNWWSTRAERIAAVDASALQAAYQRYMPIDKMHVVVVGDASKILPQLEKLSLGRVDVRPPIPAPKPAK